MRPPACRQTETAVWRQHRKIQRFAGSCWDFQCWPRSAGAARRTWGPLAVHAAPQSRLSPIPAAQPARQLPLPRLPARLFVVVSRFLFSRKQVGPDPAPEHFIFPPNLPLFLSHYSCRDPAEAARSSSPICQHPPGPAAPPQPSLQPTTTPSPSVQPTSSAAVPEFSPDPPFNLAICCLLLASRFKPVCSHRDQPHAPPPPPQGSLSQLCRCCSCLLLVRRVELCALLPLFAQYFGRAPAAAAAARGCMATSPAPRRILVPTPNPSIHPFPHQPSLIAASLHLSPSPIRETPPAFCLPAVRGNQITVQFDKFP